MNTQNDLKSINPLDALVLAGEFDSHDTAKNIEMSAQQRLWSQPN